MPKLDLAAGSTDMGPRLACVVLIAVLAGVHSLAQGTSQASHVLTRIEWLEAAQRQLQDELRALRDDLRKLIEPSGSVATSEPPVPREPVRIAGAPRRGSADAKLVLIEYSDFHCAFCGRHARDTAPLIERQLVETGKVQYVFLNLPLTRLHPQAAQIAVAAECAKEQDKFWDLHERLFASARSARIDQLDEVAAAISLNLETFHACRNGGLADKRVREGVEAARRLGITSTPTFLIGIKNQDGSVQPLRRIAGAQPFPVFKGIVEQLAGATDR